MTATALTRPGERDRAVIKFGEIDWVLALIVALIATAGGVMLFSIAGSSWKPWAADHLIRFGVFFILMIVLALIDLRVWFHMAYPIYAMALVLLAAVAVVGEVRLGARRWLHLGPMNLQPSEIMKIAIVLALARFYHGVSAKDAQWSWKLIVPALMILIPAGLVYRQPDLGTTILIVLTGGTVMVLAGLSLRVVLAGVVAGAVAMPVVVLKFLHGYQRDRIMTLIEPDKDPSGAGYHILQSKIALGSGGLLGRGYGLGSQSQLNFLPEKQTDFIFSTLAEEFGFIGCISMLALYAAASYISLRIASVAHSHFGRLSAAGVTATFTFYMLINGAMVMGLAPVVGIPMPLLSYGGTVMLTVMVGFGLVQCVRVHRYSEITSGKGSLL
jgi:rod shape determining protein RodA